MTSNIWLNLDWTDHALAWNASEYGGVKVNKHQGRVKVQQTTRWGKGKQQGVQRSKGKQQGVQRGKGKQQGVQLGKGKKTKMSTVG